MKKKPEKTIPTLSFKRAVALLQKADFIVLVAEDGTRSIADFVGYESEGDELGDFNVGADDWGDVFLAYGQSAEIHYDAKGRLSLRFYGYTDDVIPVYAKRKE